MVYYLLSAPSIPLLIHSQDRRPLTLQSLVAPPPATDLTQAPAKQDIVQSECTGSSAKIDQLIHLLELIPSDGKSLVFSQFTSFLDKVVAFHNRPRVFALTGLIDWRGIAGAWASWLAEYPRVTC